MSPSRFVIAFGAAIALQVLAIAFCVALWGNARALIGILYGPLFKLIRPRIEDWVSLSGLGIASSGLGIICIGILTYSLLPAVAAAFCSRRDEKV